MIWHYTIGEWAAEIIAEGVLRPATAYITPGEKPILWFSANQFWEPTANKMEFDPETREHRTLTMEETAGMGGGLLRFGIPAARAIRWPDVGKAAGMKAKWRGSLMKVGRQQGADPKDWYGVIGSIPVAETVIQGMRCKDKVWTDYNPVE